jgi:hypothetical protein
MRFALADQDSWACFIARKRPEVVEMLGWNVFPSLFGDVYGESPQSLYNTNADSIGMLTLVEKKSQP